MTDRTEFKIGETLILTSGSYSDYCIIGLFKVLKDFDTSDFKEKRVLRNKWDSLGIEYQELINSGYLEDVEHIELWVKD